MLERRSFLSGLVGLPLVGGAVSLIGRPTAAAVPVTSELLRTYETWLDLERSNLIAQTYGVGSRGYHGGSRYEVVWRHKQTGECWSVCRYDNPAPEFGYENAASRAAVVLAAVGCPVGGRWR